MNVKRYYNVEIALIVLIHSLFEQIVPLKHRRLSNFFRLAVFLIVIRVFSFTPRGHKNLDIFYSKIPLVLPQMKFCRSLSNKTTKLKLDDGKGGNITGLSLLKKISSTDRNEVILFCVYVVRCYNK